MSFLSNVILLTDSYKFSHNVQYPEGTTEVYSYFESRGGEFDEITFVGLQYFLKEYLTKPITQADIDEAESAAKLHFGSDKLFNKAGWQYILDNHKGKLPLSIKAVPEGMVVGTKNVLMTVVNTDPNCFWLTNYMETLLSEIWYPCTVASLSRAQKKLIKASLDKSADNDAGLMFKLHDFGFRGVSSVETAAIGGMAHLVNFMGTDTFAGLQLAKKYYGCEMAGYSIPASEHSTITSWGRENEVVAMENMLDKYPEGLVACVSDSYNIYRACKEYWGTILKDKVLNRNGTLVVRPDSGEPVEVVPAVLDALGEKFGFTLNSKGYKMLPPQVRVIQGDGIDKDSLSEILNAIMDAGWSTDNVAFGSGGGLLQKVNRDTCKFAFKCCSITINGEQRDVYKQPIGSEWKMSKKGKLKLVNVSGKLSTLSSSTDSSAYQAVKDELVEVYRNGEILVEYSFDQVRTNSSL